MHIELTETLCCPDCGPGHGLVAFVERMEARRIVEGRLDCPVCERRHAIRGGAVRLGAERDDATDDTVLAEPDEGRALLAHALLGPPDGPETLLLLDGALGLAPGLAGARPDAAVLSFATTLPPAADRVFPIVAASADHDPPIRPFALAGVVGAGEAGARLIPRVASLIREGGRVIVLDPPDPEAASVHPELRVLAADPRAWVAARVRDSG